MRKNSLTECREPTAQLRQGAGWAQGLDAERLFYGKHFIITLVFAHCNNICRASVADCLFGARKVGNADGAGLGMEYSCRPRGGKKLLATI